MLGRASSQWVLLDINERILRRSNAIGKEYPVDETLKKALVEPEKIKMPEHMELACTRTVLYSDVDMNGHMNNVKYANWICELFSSDVLKTKSMRNLKITYAAEAYLDQKVDLFFGAGETGYFICGKTEGKTVFDGFIEWQGE